MLHTTASAPYVAMPWDAPIQLTDDVESTTPVLLRARQAETLFFYSQQRCLLQQKEVSSHEPKSIVNGVFAWVTGEVGGSMMHPSQWSDPDPVGLHWARDPWQVVKPSLVVASTGPDDEHTLACLSDIP